MKFSRLYFVLVFISCVFALPQNALALDSWQTITPAGAGSYTFYGVTAMDNYIFLATSNGVFKSTDAGANWTNITTGLAGSALTVRTVAIGWTYNSSTYQYEVSGSSPVYIATAGGVFSSTLDGSDWTSLNSGLPDTDVKDVEIDQYQASQGSVTNIYAATPSGVFRSSDSGTTWTLVDSGMSGQSVTDIATDPEGKIFAMTANGKVFVSAINSYSGSDESWASAFDSAGTTTTSISILSGNGEIAWLATSAGVQKSDPSGLVWTAKNIGVATGTVTMVESAYTVSSIAYAAASGYGVYKTINEAESSPHWVTANIGLTDLAIEEVATNPGNSNLIYAMSAGGLYKLEVSDPYVDMSPPSTISDLVVTNGGDGTYTLTWSDPGDDGIYGYAWSFSIRYATSTPITTDNWSSATPLIGGPTPWTYGRAESFTIPALSDGYTYYFAIRSTDNAGNVSALSNVQTVTAADTSAPTTPGSFAATADSTTAISLSWTASTDNVGVVAYTISRGGTVIATTTATSYSDSGLTASTEYSYTVTAYDAAENVSSAASASATTSAVPVVVVTPPSSGGGGGEGGGGGGGGTTPSSPVVSVLKRGTGTGIVGAMSYGINCGITCAYAYSQYSTVVLLAYPEKGAKISSWSGCSYITSGYCVITNISTSTVITATFDLGQAVAAPVLIATAPTTQPNAGSILPALPVPDSVLVVGKTGPQVTQLQNFLIQTGYLAAGNNTGYFGPLTNAAVKKYQAARLVSMSASARSGGTSGSSNLVVQTMLPLPPEAAFYSIGSRGTGVINLQNILISRGYLAYGNNTGYFGPLTNAAVQRYQTAYRTYLASNSGLYGTGQVVVAATTSVAKIIPSQVFKRNLTVGMQGEDVRQLQKFLNGKGFYLASFGPGSLGNETTYFGPATQKALVKFQETYVTDVTRTGTTIKGTGVFGLSTRNKVIGLIEQRSIGTVDQ